MTGPRRGQRWGALFAVGFGAGVFVGGTEQALRGLLDGTRWNWAEMGLYILLWAVIMPPFWWLMARTAGRGSVSRGPIVRTRAQLKELIGSALRAGALPLQANPDFWRPALADEALRWNVLRWVSVGYAVVGGGVVSAAAVIADHNARGTWAVAVLLVAGGLAAFRVSAQRLHVARRLLREVATS